jgi:hypothetical protein
VVITEQEGKEERLERGYMVSTKTQFQVMPVILATQESEIRRFMVQSQPRQMKVSPVLKIPNTKMGWQSGSRGI